MVQSVQRGDVRYGHRRSLEQAMFSIVASRVAPSLRRPEARARPFSALGSALRKLGSECNANPPYDRGRLCGSSERTSQPHKNYAAPSCRAYSARDRRRAPNLIENSEYQAALAEQGLNEARIAELETKLARAEVIDVSKLSGETVKFGATVTLTDQDTGEERICHIVGEPEADAARAKISVSSPLARALISKSQGAVVAVETPGGDKSYKIERVSWLP